MQIKVLDRLIDEQLDYLDDVLLEPYDGDSLYAEVIVAAKYRIAHYDLDKLIESKLSELLKMSSNNGTQPNVGDFISQFIAFYDEMESPTSFWRWAGYSIIAATLRDRVYYEYGAGRIYPNIYVVLLADSAQYRKGAPIIAARSLLNSLKVTKVFSGTASIQAVLDELSQDIASKNGVTIKGGSSMITADELAAFFVTDPRLIPLLTDIWEYRDEYPYKLRGGSIVVKNICTTMLAASNETFLREVYDSRAVYGGLLGRTYMIKPNETRPPNSLMDMNLDRYDKTPLLTSLAEVRKLTGPITITREGAALYKEWYNELYRKYKTHPDRTGVLQRMHTNVLKLAIILAAANYSLEITAAIFNEAIFQVTALRQNYDIYVMSAGKSNLAEIGAAFLSAMWESETRSIGRKAFLFKHWGEVTAEDFDKLVDTLMQGGAIEIDIQKSEIGYKMTVACIQTFEKKEAAK